MSLSLEEKTQEFWWAAKMVRLKNDAASFEVLLTLEADHYLPPRLKNRIMEIKRERDKNNPTPSGGPIRGPSVA